MTSYTLSETRSFYGFIFLTFITAGVFLWHGTIGALPNEVFGFVKISWGLFAFYRALFLSNFSTLKIPKILSLPSRILFDLDQKKQGQINLILARFLKQDILLFLFIGLTYCAWGIYCTLFPLEIDLFENFWKEKEGLLNADISPVKNYYAIVEELSHIVMQALIVLTALSFSQNIKVEKSGLIFMPVIIGLGFFMVTKTSLVNMDYYHGLSYLKGIGWGQYEYFLQLVSGNDIVDTGYIRRYVETGISGVAWLPVLFIPIFFCLNKGANMSKLTGWAGTALLLFLLASDQFVAYSSLTIPFQILCLAYISLIWGLAGKAERLE